MSRSCGDRSFAVFVLIALFATTVSGIVRGLLAVLYAPAGVINGIVIVRNSHTSVRSCSACSLRK